MINNWGLLILGTRLVSLWSVQFFFFFWKGSGRDHYLYYEQRKKEKFLFCVCMHTVPFSCHFLGGNSWCWSHMRWCNNCQIWLDYTSTLSVIDPPTWIMCSMDYTCMWLHASSVVMVIDFFLCIPLMLSSKFSVMLLILHVTILVYFA